MGVFEIYVELLWIYMYGISTITEGRLDGDENTKLKKCNIRWDVLDNNFKELGCGTQMVSPGIIPTKIGKDIIDIGITSKINTKKGEKNKK